MDKGKRGEATLDQEKTNEAIEEIRFYLEHGMPEQASAAFEKLQAVSDDEATLNAIRAEIEAASQHSSPVGEVTQVEAISEFATDEPQAEFTIDEISADVPESATFVEETSPEPPADVAVADRRGWTALYLASSNRHEAVVRLLLEKGANVKAKDGGMAMYWATRNGHYAVVRLLKQAQPSIYQRLKLSVRRGQGG